MYIYAIGAVAGEGGVAGWHAARIDTYATVYVVLRGPLATFAIVISLLVVCQDKESIMVFAHSYRPVYQPRDKPDSHMETDNCYNAPSYP